MLLGGARGVEGVAGVGDLGGDGDLDEGVTTCKGQSATRSTVCTEHPCSLYSETLSSSSEDGAAGSPPGVATASVSAG